MHSKYTTKDENPMQKLEEALLLCKFGRFHVLLMVASMCAIVANFVIILSASYILPSAECDLNMNIMEKAMLNAMPFIGQVSAALFIGFLTDSFGRRIFLIGGHICIFLCNMFQGAAQTYWVLALGKLIDGIFVSVCFNTTSVMVSECTHKNVRDQALIVWSSFLSVAYIVIAFISWAILPQQWDIIILKGYFELHSWNFYLYICSIWSLIAAILFYYLPESPKFLLSCGQEDEALDVIKKIYSINTGKDAATFPITSLTAPNTIVPASKTSLKKQLVVMLLEAKKLFRPPLITRLCLLMIIHCIGLFTACSLGLWYPQISTIIESYQTKNGDNGMFCEMIDDYMTNNLNDKLPETNSTGSGICVSHVFGFKTYITGVLIGSFALLCYIMNVCLVKYFGQKPLMFILFIMCAFCSGVIYWTSSLTIIAILFSAAVALVQSALGLLYNVLVRVFPTSFRALAFSFVMIAGRFGNVLGSILFPIMLRVACIGPFIFLFITNIFAAILVLLLPNPAKEKNGSGDQ